jgi:hypothetical protein
MAINDVLSALAQKMGLQTTRLEDLEKIKANLGESIRRNQDKLCDLKARVAEVDAQLRAKKKEYDAAGPGIRKIIKSEFALLFRQQDQVLETLDSISSRIVKDNDIVHKVDLLIEALKNPPRTDYADEVADDLSDVLGDLRQEEKSVSKMNEVSFSRMEEVSDGQIAAIAAVGEASPGRQTAGMDRLDEMIMEIN